MIRIIIGNQGSGKSGLGVYFLKKYLKKGIPCFSNLPVRGCFKFEKDDLMTYEFPEGSVLLFDEGATYGLGSRGNLYKKNTTEALLEFFTMHRHYHVKDVIIISPNFNDILPAVRDNATQIILVRNGLLGLLFGLSNYKFITRSYEINEQSKQIEYGYSWKPWSTRFFPRWTTYDYYDSWVSKTLEHKDWELYSTFEERLSYKEKFLARLKDYQLSNKFSLKKILPKIRKNNK